MREFSKFIESHLQNGLRPERRRDRNADFLHDAFNVRISRDRIEPYVDVSDPFEGASFVDFPFPYVHIGEHRSLYLGRNTIHYIDRSGPAWTVQNIPVYAIDGLPGDGIVPGGPWHVVDLKTSFYLFNGVCTVAIVQGRDHALVDRVIRIGTGTHFRGRVVVGGINPHTIWTRGWHEIFTFWQRYDNMLPDIGLDDAKNYVMWGSIGGGDFPLWLFDPEIIHRGPIKQFTRDGTHRIPAQETYAMDRIRQGQFGFMPLPFSGDILRVKELGNGVMVYGSEGVAYMPHVAGAELAPTFGLQMLNSVGIAGRSAVGGTEHMHVFIDTYGDLWRINAEMQLSRLGYREWLAPMLGTDIIISYDPHFADFYISNSDVCYLYTGDGMSEVHQRPTSIHSLGGELVGAFDEVPDEDARIVTNTFDMNIRAQKTITAIGVGISTESPVYVAVDYRYSKGDEYQRSHFVRLNKEGNAVLRVAGTEFRVVVHVPDRQDMELDYIKVRWQSSDKRPIHGVDDSTALTDMDMA